MLRSSQKPLLFTFILVLSLLHPVSGAEKSKEQAKITSITFTDLGINLYDKFRFESEGELFDLIDKESKILVPAGAVLTCIRSSYTIGYFAGGGTVADGNQVLKIPKIFFILRPSGEVTFHSPTPDGNFPDKQLPGSIIFNPLYKADTIEQPAATSPDLAKPETFIGLTLETAEAAAKTAKIPHRVIEIDGQPRPVTMDYRPERLNFAIQNGKIIRVTKG